MYSESSILTLRHGSARDITTNCGEGDVAPPNRANTTEQLMALRGRMAELGLAAYYVPYDSEGRREWISGFTGSNGDAIVTNAKSGNQVGCLRCMQCPRVELIFYENMPS